MAYRLHPRPAVRVPNFAQQDLALRIGQRARELPNPRATGAVGAALGRAAGQVLDEALLAHHDNWERGLSTQAFSASVGALDTNAYRAIRKALVWTA